MNEQLLDLIRTARRHWRLRLVLRGLAILAVCALAAVLVATWGMDRFRFTPGAVRFFQAAAWLSIAATAWWSLGGVIRRRTSDAQVALYMEEHEPALQGRLLTAVACTGAERPHVSRAMVDRVVADAVRECESRPAWRRIERRGIATAGAVLGATVLSSLLLLVVPPGFLAHGARFLLPSAGAGERPYTIGVEPGDTTIARGADLAAHARLRGFTSGQVELVVRRAGDESWERLPMVPGDELSYSGLVLDLRTDLEYFVEAAGVRSETHTVRVADIPWVEAIAVEYHFPSYTGLAVQRQLGGDVAAIAGTTAHVIIRPTLSVAGGRLIVLGTDTVAMRPDTGGTVRGSFVVRASGEYRAQFPGPDGRAAAGSPSYSIEVLADQPPEVSFTRPGRDADATSVDEVFLEARAADDVGVRRLDLVYRVNGGPERTVPLHRGAPRREVVAGHTVYLEELSLQPGDVVSYYARAMDGRPDTASSLTDIYFLTIRPFDRAFREAEQNGMPGGEGGVNAGEMSERQRQIVAGTFRVARERAQAGEARFREDLATLTLAQGRLREEVETLLRRLRTRGVAEADSSMGVVAHALDSAVIAMRGAERELGRRAPQEALTPEQRALTYLQRAEAVFDRERQVARGGQQGGGGGAAASAEELADLFELELDRMRNQYETVERDQRSGDNAQVDETLERVRELARRQQQENERRRAQPPSGSGSSSSAGQRRLAEEAEQLARQLERLSRERQDQELTEAARRLREAADQMRRSAASQGASGNTALDRLREAQRDLERGRSSGLRRGIDEARQRAERLSQQQAQTAAEVGALGNDSGRAARLQRLMDRKNLMVQDVGSMEDDLERLAREAQAEQPQAAQRLREAARGLREGRLEDKIRYSRGLMQAGDPEVARNFEEQIATDLDSLTSRLDAAASAVGEAREDRVGRALERARDAANALEGIAERQQQGQNGQQGRRENGQNGQNGQQGRDGQSGQQGGQAQPGGSGGDRRQLQRAIGEQRRELMGIRDQLRAEGVDTRELDGLINNLDRADNDGVIGTPRGIEALTQIVIPGLREYEFGVRRAISGAAETPRIGSEGAVPERYRRLVAEYFRGLAEPRP